MTAQGLLKGDSRLKPKEVKKRVGCVGSVVSQIKRSHATRFCQGGKKSTVRHANGKWSTVIVKNEEREGCAEGTVRRK